MSLYIGQTMPEHARVPQDFVLPEDAVTETFGIVARRGAGKTYLMKKFAEELIEHRHPVVLLDPTGVCWGLRSNAKGDGPGLPVTILGGDHGDRPLLETAGALVAEIVASGPVALVLDLSHFETRAAQRRFTTDFARELYRKKANRRDPVMVLLDEADEFAPQGARGDDLKMVGAYETLVRRGRSRGIGCCMVTQRPASLNKSVLTQVECLVVMQLTGPQDKDAVKDWVAGNASPDELKTVMQSLASLKAGEAWFWSPVWLSTLQRVQVGRISTFDSSATPKAGEERPVPKVLAPVDLERFDAELAEMIEKARQDDPKELRARIRELEKELKSRPEGVRVEEVRVEVVPQWLIHEIEACHRGAQRDHEQALQAKAVTVDALGMVLGEIRERAEAADGERVSERAAPRGRDRGRRPAVAGGVSPSGVRGQHDRTHGPPDRGRDGGRARRAGPDGADVGKDLPRVGKAGRAFLSAIAQFGPIDRKRLALTAGYTPTSGHVGNTMSELRNAELVTDGWPVEITPLGLRVLGEYDELPEGAELFDWWMQHGRERTQGKFGKAEKAFLEVLRNGDELHRDEIGEAAGYETDSGHVGNTLSRLVGLGLVERVSAGRYQLAEELR